MSTTPLLGWGPTGIQPHGRGSDGGANLGDGKIQERPAPSHAKGGPVLNSDEKSTGDALADLAFQLGGAQGVAELSEVFAEIFPKKLVNGGKKRESEAAEVDLDTLMIHSAAFAILSRRTSMATAASAFSLAVERFASGKDNRKRVADTALNKAGMGLSAAAWRALPSEATFASLATKLAGDAQLVLLSDFKPVPLRSRWRRWKWRPAASDAYLRAGRRSRMARLLAATIPLQEPVLPVHTANGGEMKLISKRQIMYAVTVALPVSLLASAAGVKVFAGAGAWAAGAGVCMWIIASAGMVLNQYGKFKWEMMAARHLNRLCLLGGGVLPSFYAFRAYFPSETWALWFLIAVAVALLIVPWILSTIRSDDIVPAEDKEMEEGADKTTGQNQYGLS